MIEFYEGALFRSEVLIVAFTGVSHGLGAIPFEFYRSLRGSSVLFVSDKAQSWYQIGGDEILSNISRAKNHTGADNIVCLGNSMGGFGALLYASIIDADAVLAFVPQTTILPQQTREMGDFRYEEYQTRIADFPNGDLARLKPARQVTLCYGDDPLDVAHATRLAWPAKHHVVPGSGHGPAAMLRGNGTLLPLIKASLLNAAPAYRPGA